MYLGQHGGHLQALLAVPAPSAWQRTAAQTMVVENRVIAGHALRVMVDLVVSDECNTGCGWWRHDNRRLAATGYIGGRRLYLPQR